MCQHIFGQLDWIRHIWAPNEDDTVSKTVDDVILLVRSLRSNDTSFSAAWHAGPSVVVPPYEVWSSSIYGEAEYSRT
jgi:hypothetical protein